MKEGRLKTHFCAKPGFALIELLVVGLIIGVLAAVALPQYQLAVEKSRVMQALVAAQSIYEAEQRYFLEHGTYTKQLEDLDVPFACTGTGRQYKCGGSLGHLIFTALPSVYIYPGVPEMAIEQYFAENKTLCQSSTGRKRKLCISLGGIPHPTAEGYYILP